MRTVQILCFYCTTINGREDSHSYPTQGKWLLSTQVYHHAHLFRADRYQTGFNGQQQLPLCNWEEDNLANPLGGTEWVFNSLTGELTVLVSSEIEEDEFSPWFRFDELIVSVVVLEGAAFISSSAFSDCREIEHISIPNSVTSIGDSAFENCDSLESITIPDSVREIGKEAFCGCSGLESLTFPDSVKEIGDEAFYGCESLVSVTIPGSVERLGEEASEQCPNLLEIVVVGEIQNFIVVDDALYDKEVTRLIWISPEKSGSYEIPNTVKTIDRDAFRLHGELASITIPDSFTEVESSIFRGCSGLEMVTIPDSVTSIGHCAFRDCCALESIAIPDCVACIDDYAFSGCKALAAITIPDSVTYIGNGAFQGCSALRLSASLAMSPMLAVWFSKTAANWNPSQSLAQSTLLARVRFSNVVR